MIPKMDDASMAFLEEFADPFLWDSSNLNFSFPQDSDLAGIHNEVNVSHAAGELLSDPFDFTLLFPSDINNFNDSLPVLDEPATVEDDDEAVDLLRENGPEALQGFSAFGRAQEGLETHTGNGPIADSTPVGRTRRGKARGPSAMSWSTQKANIRRLYMDEDHTLEATKRMMEEKYNFNATSVPYIPSAHPRPPTVLPLT